jgi:hypothetical protein
MEHASEKSRAWCVEQSHAAFAVKDMPFQNKGFLISFIVGVLVAALAGRTD